MSGMRGSGRSVGHAGSTTRWSLRALVGTILGLAGVAVLAVAVWSTVAAVHARDVVTNEQHTVLPASANVQTLLSAMVDQETGLRGYLLTTEDKFLDPYRTGGREVNTLFPELARELKGTSSGLKDLAKVQTAYAAWLHQIAQPEITETEEGHESVAIATEDAGSGKASFDRLRASVSTLGNVTDDAIVVANQTVDHQLSETIVLVALRTAVVAVLIALTLLALRRWFNRPIEQLALEVRSVAQGELDRPILAGGPVELANLGRDVEAMRRRLRDENDEIRQLREALALHRPLYSELQSELEPSAKVHGLEVAGRLVPVEGVIAGDWYDTWDVSQKRCLVALVDISGHGPTAGLFALKIKHLLSPALRSGLTPGAALDWVAQECGESDEQFATGIVLDLDLGAETCSFANAGHPSGLLFRGGEVDELESTGPIMCALPGSWATNEVAIESGDLIVLATDGVLEAATHEGDEFGLHGIIETIGALQEEAPADDVAESLVTSIRENCRLPLKDDATIVVVRVGSEGEFALSSASR
jgi:serine phosphatase RsbU (regulator of sigma subunit)/CHASE3 domain sensor protein